MEGIAMTSLAERKRRETAIHEAGHAIAAKAFGARNLTLSVYDDKGGHGACQYDLGADSQAFEKSLVVLMAGPIAADIAAGLDPMTIPQPEWQVARGYLRLEGEPRPNAYEWALDQLRPEFPSDEWHAERLLDGLAADSLRLAVSVVRNNWSEIERLAEQLESRGEISA
jgi:hypothetical protein